MEQFEKSNKNKFFTKGKIIFVTFLSVFTLAAYGSYRTVHRHLNKFYVLEKISNELNLTHEQEEKLLAVKESLKDLKKDKDNFKKEMKELKNKIREMVLSEELDDKEIEKVIMEKQKLMMEKIHIILPKIKDFHKSLDKDQKKQIVEYMDEFKVKMRKKHAMHKSH